MLAGEVTKHQFNCLFHLIISLACLDTQLCINKNISNTLFNHTLSISFSIIDWNFMKTL